jgi:1,4-dihydroxy-2-naphthoate octaprenyltransferase
VLVVAAVGGLYLAWISSWVILAVGAAAIVAAGAYTGGPWPYGYHGLGEVFVFLFFGLAAVVGSRYVHDATMNREAWLLAIPVGFVVTAILVANNVRDLETDRDAGKHTLAVLLGRRRTRILYGTLLFGAFALIAGYAALDLTPRWTLLALGALPLAVAPVRTVATLEAGPELIRALRANARLHLAVGVLLGVGAAI